MDKMVNTKCSKCGADIRLKHDSYYYRTRNNRPILCDKCYKEYRSDVAKRTWENKSEESIRLSNKKKSESAKRYWQNLDNDTKEKQIKRMEQSHQNWLSNLSKEDRESFKNKMRNSWETKSEEEKAKEIIRLKQIAQDYREKMTNEDREMIRLKKIEHWHNRSKEDKDEWSNATKKRWEDMDESYRKEFIRRRILESSGTNKLHQRFEKSFVELNTSLHLVPEYATTHSWDYGILKDDKLVAVVDLDGEYFHGDKSDYDGIHSKYEYDIKRGESIPPNTKHCIIREKYFDEDFDWLVNVLPLSYEQFVQDEVKFLTSIPFPYPSYTDIELIDSWNKLVKMDPKSEYYSPTNQCHLGDRMIFHFCHSLYDERIWKPEWIEEAVRSHMIYHPHMNRNKLLLCVPHEEFTPPGQARINLKHHTGEYIDIQCDVGIMLGCIAAKIPYRTKCTNISRYNEIRIMLTWLSRHGIRYKVNIEEG